MVSTEQKNSWYETGKTERQWGGYVHGLCDFWLKAWNLAEEYNFMCLLNVDMEPSWNILGYRDISGIQNSHHLKPEVKFSNRK